MNMELFCNGKRIDNATWADVEAVLPELKEEAFFRLTIVPRPETGADMLEIQAENGNYMPLMGNVGGGGRAFHNPAMRDAEMVEFGGYEYDPIGTTQDYALIVRMIREFYHTGTVPEELWKPQS